jgi:hypothetical protein
VGKKLNGLQLGLFNYAKESDGPYLQLGLINYSNKIPFPIIKFGIKKSKKFKQKPQNKKEEGENK